MHEKGQTDGDANRECDRTLVGAVRRCVDRRRLAAQR